MLKDIKGIHERLWMVVIAAGGKTLFHCADKRKWKSSIFIAREPGFLVKLLLSN